MALEPLVVVEEQRVISMYYSIVFYVPRTSMNRHSHKSGGCTITATPLPSEVYDKQ